MIFDRRVIVRAVLVVEYQLPGERTTGAVCYTQSGGDIGLSPFEYDLGPPGFDVHLKGRGEMTLYRHADDLFAQWGGRQPESGRDAAIEPHRPEINP